MDDEGKDVQRVRLTMTNFSVRDDGVAKGGQVFNGPSTIDSMTHKAQHALASRSVEVTRRSSQEVVHMMTAGCKERYLIGA